MIRYQELRRIRESYEGQASSLREARIGFLREVFDVLGLGCRSDGVPLIPTDERGLPRLKPGRASMSEFSLRNLAEAIMGHDFVQEYYHPSSGFEFRGLQEAAIDPTAFLNINTFNLATAGLVQAEVMERFSNPAYIGRELVRIVPTNKNGDKLIAVARMGSVSSAVKGRKPGEPHAEVGYGEAWQTTPETVERALKCTLTREAVFYDLTGQVQEEAAAVGDELAYGMDKDIADAVLGVTNSYNRNGTSYDTYQASSPWANDHSNPLEDYTDIDNALSLFRGMTDPESGREILVQPDTILVAPDKELTINRVLNSTELRETTNTNTVTISPNPLAGRQFRVVSSQIWFNRCTASDGLNLSVANAKLYWWIGDFRRAFEWRENWPLTPWQASADELHLKDHGLIAVYGANYRGVPYVREPRYVVRNKN